MGVPILATGVDARSVDCDVGARSRELVPNLDRAGDRLEPAPDRRHHRVADRELHAGVDGIDLPGAGEVGGDHVRRYLHSAPLLPSVETPLFVAERACDGPAAGSVSRETDSRLPEGRILRRRALTSSTLVDGWG